jgi:hypothetical protein
MKARLILPACLACLALGAAAQPSGFARQWPIAATVEDGIVLVDLDEPVYAQLVRDDLGDVAAFGADGRALQLAPVRLPPVPTSRSADVTVFPLSAEAGAAAPGRLSLHLSSAADGSVRTDIYLDAQPVPTPALVQHWLLDLQPLRGEAPISLEVLWPEDAPDFNRQVVIESSPELTHWSPAGQVQALVHLQHDGVRLQRRILHLDNARQRFLRISPADATPGLPPLAGIRAVMAGQQVERPPLRTLRLQGRALEGGAAGEYAYTLPGPLPVFEFELLLPDANSVARVEVGSTRQPRPDERGQVHYRDLASFDAYRIAQDGRELSTEAQVIAPTRERHWRVRTRPALSRPPELVLHYFPDRFAVLTQGEPPYYLAAGSAQAVRQDAPVEVAMMAMRTQHGAGWKPRVASLGESSELEGEAARHAQRPFDWKTWVLWGVLLLGAVLVAAASWKVLRGSAGEPPSA